MDSTSLISKTVDFRNYRRAAWIRARGDFLTPCPIAALLPVVSKIGTAFALVPIW
jgi:hypothetical protein